MAINKLTVLALILSIAMLSNCSSRKKGKNIIPIESSLTTEYIDTNSLIVTFSTSNRALTQYAQLKMGLIDIIIHVRDEETLWVQSLYNRSSPQIEKPTHVNEFDLTYLDEETQLFHGVFNVPAGTLEKVDVIISPLHTSIASKEQKLTLVNSFSQPLQNDLETSINIPIHVQTIPANDFILSKNSVAIMNIDIDMDMSIKVEPLNNTDKQLASFTPAIQINEVEKNDLAFESFPLAFKQLQYIDMTVDDDDKLAMAIGNQQEMLFISNYDIATNAELTLNGNTVESLHDINGLHFFDMVGLITINENGYHYQINKMSAVKINGSENSFIYEGIVTDIDDEQLSLHGYRLPLSSESAPIRSGTYFNDKINGSIEDISIGETVSLWAEKEADQLIIFQKNTDIKHIDFTQRLLINTTIALPATDIFNINKAIKKDNVSAWEIDELDCLKHITLNGKKNLAACLFNETFNQIAFDHNQIGQFTLIETRQAEQDKTTTLVAANILIHKPSLVQHFTRTDEFIDALNSKISEASRPVKFLAEGEIIEGVFHVKGVAGMMLLKSIPFIDEETDAWLSEFIETKASGLPYTSIPFLSLYDQNAEAYLSSASDYISKRNQQYANAIIPYHQYIPKNASITYGTGIGATLYNMPEIERTISATPGVQLIETMYATKENNNRSDGILTATEKPVIIISNAPLLEGIADSRENTSNQINVLKGETPTELSLIFNSVQRPVPAALDDYQRPRMIEMLLLEKVIDNIIYQYTLTNTLMYQLNFIMQPFLNLAVHNFIEESIKSRNIIDENSGTVKQTIDNKDKDLPKKLRPLDEVHKEMKKVFNTLKREESRVILDSNSRYSDILNDTTNNRNYTESEASRRSSTLSVSPSLVQDYIKNQNQSQTTNTTRNKIKYKN